MLRLFVCFRKKPLSVKVPAPSSLLPPTIKHLILTPRENTKSKKKKKLSYRPSFWKWSWFLNGFSTTPKVEFFLFFPTNKEEGDVPTKKAKGRPPNKEGRGDAQTTPGGETPKQQGGGGALKNEARGSSQPTREERLPNQEGGWGGDPSPTNKGGKTAQPRREEGHPSTKKAGGDRPTKTGNQEREEKTAQPKRRREGGWQPSLLPTNKGGETAQPRKGEKETAQPRRREGDHPINKRGPTKKEWEGHQKRKTKETKKGEKKKQEKKQKKKKRKKR